MVQIGAFSQGPRRCGWNDAAGFAPGDMAGKGKRVVPLTRPTDPPYRTPITGFASRDEAVALCAKLKAAGRAVSSSDRAASSGVAPARASGGRRRRFPRCGSVGSSSLAQCRNACQVRALTDALRAAVDRPTQPGLNRQEAGVWQRLGPALARYPPRAPSRPSPARPGGAVRRWFASARLMAHDLPAWRQRRIARRCWTARPAPHDIIGDRPMARRRATWPPWGGRRRRACWPERSCGDQAHSGHGRATADSQRGRCGVGSEPGRAGGAGLRAVQGAWRHGPWPWTAHVLYPAVDAAAPGHDLAVGDRASDSGAIRL